jgi:hypothetical protein
LKNKLAVTSLLLSQAYIVKANLSEDPDYIAWKDALTPDNFENMFNVEGFGS